MKNFFKKVLDKLSKAKIALSAAVATVALVLQFVGRIDSYWFLEDLSEEIFPDLYNVVTPTAKFIETVTGVDSATAFSTGFLALLLVAIPAAAALLRGKNATYEKATAALGAIATVSYGFYFYYTIPYDLNQVTTPIFLGAIAFGAVSYILNHKKEVEAAKKAIDTQEQARRDETAAHAAKETELMRQITEDQMWESVWAAAAGCQVAKNDPLQVIAAPEKTEDAAQLPL